MNLNKIFVLGNLTRDPIIRVLPSGQSVANFGVATNRFFYDKDRQKQEQTEFHNIVAFGRIAEIAQQYLRKGSMVLIEGRVQTRSWEDPSGNKRYKTEIVTERLQLGPRTASFQAVPPEFPASGQSQAQPYHPKPWVKGQKGISQEDIPIIEEGKEENKPPAASTASAPPAKEKPQQNPTEKNPLEDRDQDEEEIDISRIPF